MKVQQIQSGQTFEAKQRFLNKKQLADAQDLLKRMNSETEYIGDKYSFTSQIVGTLKIGDNSYLHDERCLIAPSDYMKGFASIDLKNTKSKIFFDIESGEILSYKKPFFRTWGNIMSQISQTLDNAMENYNNSSIVKKFTYGIEGLTESGYKKLQEMLRG